MILVFAKAPVAGTVKTRLIPTLGAQGAAQLHRRMVRHTLQTACATGERVVLYCAPDVTHDFFAACAEEFGISLAEQSGDELGARMAHALRDTLRTERRAVLIGTDCPALTVDVLQAALDALETHDHVFVPVEDGGYALVGARAASGAGALLFENMIWSHAQVMAHTRQRLRESGANWRELETLWDVDEAPDLARLVGHGAGRSLLDGLLQAQQC